MDPNECLRLLLDAWKKGYKGAIREQSEALTRWLRNGGFAPTAHAPVEYRLGKRMPRKQGKVFAISGSYNSGAYASLRYADGTTDLLKLGELQT